MPDKYIFSFKNTNTQHKQGNKAQILVNIPPLKRTLKSWNQLPEGLLASFPCKLNTFRKRVKKVVTSKGLQAGCECK